MCVCVVYNGQNAKKIAERETGRYGIRGQVFERNLHDRLFFSSEATL